MSPATDDRWIEVLAGRAQPDDAHTRRAARARQVLAEQLQADLDAAPDEAASRRWLNALEATAAGLRQNAVASNPVPSASVPPRAVSVGTASWVQVLRQVWHVLGTPRLAGAAAAVFGVGVAVLLVWPVQDGEDLSPKIAAPAPPAATSPAVTPGSALMATSADPLEDALALRDALRVLGVQATVVELGDATRVDAEVGADARAAVERLMKDKGVAWVAGPQLSVQFQARR
jgi:predicted component of type VI protein secretion system